MSTLNLGILAHVDAGKTSLTERLLYTAGVIDEIGSVDKGSTQTDSLALERQRGITIKAAVVSFAIGDATVNLIDTPGHPDFIAEVERVLSVLDGAVLVVSAVEGVQAQTRVLMRTLRRLRIPTLIFVNKIDRRGARFEETLLGIREKLTASVIAMGSVSGLGTRQAGFHPDQLDDNAKLVDLLADHHDDYLAAYVDGRPLDPRAELARQTAKALVHPVFFGSAITGGGVEALTAGIRELLPASSGDVLAPVSGTVFKVERGPAGEKVAYARMWSGTLRPRDKVPFGRHDGVLPQADFGYHDGALPRADFGYHDGVLPQADEAAGQGDGAVGRGDGALWRGDEAKVTAVAVFENGQARQRDSVAAGQIGKLWGLGAVQIGDAIGQARPGIAAHHFAPPTLETVIVADRACDKGALHAALAQLAEQDPLINLRQDDIRQEVSVSLYGEVQKEVIQATLASDYGLGVSFRESTTVCIERPVGAGAGLEIINKEGNPFLATVGLRVEPGPVGSGVRFGLEVELGSMPLAFIKAVEETVKDTLRQGLHGWQVTDCAVFMTHSGYWARQSHAHGSFDKSMSSTAGDFRNLTPLVLMHALREAGTTVHEPIHRFRLDIPADTLVAVLPVLARLFAIAHSTAVHGKDGELEGQIPAARVHELRQLLPGLTRGEGVLESAFDRYEPVRGQAPSRPRTDHKPLDRKEYLLHVVRRV